MGPLNYSIDLPLKVVALIVGEPKGPELWALKKLESTGCRLIVVSAESGTAVSRSQRMKRMVRSQGPLRVLSRLLGSNLIGRKLELKRSQLLERLFDEANLRDWWNKAGVEPISVPHLNHQVSQSTIAALRPDIIVRVSGGILKRKIFSLARLATLNIHHGQAPAIRGMWSIPWGIVEGRQDWIGATVHIIDDGIDTGQVLWRGSPQMAVGDTGDTLFFRSHLEACEALVRIIDEYSKGISPVALDTDQNTAASSYRTAPGLGAWLRYLYSGRGARSRVLIESAVK